MQHAQNPIFVLLQCLLLALYLIVLSVLYLIQLGKALLDLMHLAILVFLLKVLRDPISIQKEGCAVHLMLSFCMHCVRLLSSVPWTSLGGWAEPLLKFCIASAGFLGFSQPFQDVCLLHFQFRYAVLWSMAIFVGKVPASKPAIHLLERVEGRIELSARSWLVATRNFTHDVEDVNSGQPQLNHALVDELIFAPGMRQEVSTNGQPGNVSGNSPAGEDLDRTMKAPLAIVDVHALACRQVASKVITLTAAVDSVPGH